MKNANRKGRGKKKKRKKSCNRADQLDKGIGSKVDLLSLTSNNKEKKPAKAKHWSYNPTGSNITQVEEAGSKIHRTRITIKRWKRRGASNLLYGRECFRFSPPKTEMGGWVDGW